LAKEEVTSEELILKNRYYMEIVKEVNLESQVPEVQFNFDTSQNVVTITGKETDVMKVKLDLLVKVNQIASRKWKTTPYCCKFLAKLDKEDFIDHVFLKSGVKGTYSQGSNETELYGASEEDLEKMEQTKDSSSDLSRFLTEIASSLKHKHSDWNAIKGEVLQYHLLPSSPSRVSVDQVVIIGFTKIAVEAQTLAEEHIQENCTTELFIPVQCPGTLECLERFSDLSALFQHDTKIEFMKENNSLGLQIKVKSKNASETRSILTDITNSIQSQKKELQNPGAEQFIENNRDLLKRLEKTYQCVITIPEYKKEKADIDQLEESSQPEVVHSTIVHKKFKVSIVKHKVVFQDADVIVHPTNDPRGQPSRLSKVIMNHAGPKVQDELTKSINQQASREGVTYVTSAGNLSAKIIVHVVTPKCNDITLQEEDKRSALKKCILNTLEIANEKGQRSIAIPAFCSEKSKCQLQFCAIVLSAVKEFCDHNNSCYVDLSNIRLVGTNDNILSAMKKMLQQIIEPDTPTPISETLKQVSLQKQEKKGEGFTTPENLNIYLLKGNIALQESDVIVNTVSDDLNLSYGAVSKAILTVAGGKLQENTYKTKEVKDVEFGDVIPVSTKGCKIRCREVYNTVCCQYNKDNAEKILQKIIKECLEKAHASQYSSITFPALGTGNLKFPKDTVAKMFFEEIKQFSQTNPNTTLKDINMVIYEKDTETYVTFSAVFRVYLGSQVSKVQILSLPYQQHIRQVSNKIKSQKKMELDYSKFHMYRNPSTSEQSDILVTYTLQTFKNLRMSVSCTVRVISESAGTERLNECLQNMDSQPGIQFILLRTGLLIECSKVSMKKQPSDLTKFLTKVLEFCNQQNLDSVCFPVINPHSENLNCYPDYSKVSNAVFSSVEKLAFQKSASFLNRVKILDPSPNLLTVFRDELDKRRHKSSNVGFFQSFTPFILKEAHPKKKKKKKYFRIKLNQLNIHFCGEIYRQTENIDKAWEDIQHLLKREFVTKEMPVPIEQFSEEERKQIRELNKNMSVTFDKIRSCIILEGHINELCSLQAEILDWCQAKEKRDIKEKEEKLLQEKICWKFREDEKWMNFNAKTNSVLEKAYNRDTKEISVEVEAGLNIDFDLENKIATDYSGSQILICRRHAAVDMLRSNEIPDTWTDFDKDATETCSVVLLDSQTSEYMEVLNEFLQTIPSKSMILQKIKRIENPSLWRLYVARRKEMNRKRPNQQNERILYHGTKAEVCDVINADGFNRSYSGANAIVYGEGTYFAVNASYSAGDTYSQPEQGSQKKMIYRAKVLTGDYCKGQQGFKEPPLKDPKGRERYDSVVDGDNPTMYVVFQDNQAYPEYLIVLKK
uniref:Poly [ADP-ribose] polymerase n=1 Tax=Latimeria chalumnae TaxID=7897 RepID=H3A6R6_LATCH